MDSVTNTENIMMQINYGVLHPDFANAHHDILQIDMRNLGEPIRRRKFEKASTIDEMTFAAKQLNIICHYIVGLVMLLSGKHSEAYNRFHMLKNMLSTEIIDGAAPGFSIVLDNRLAVACMALVIPKNMHNSGISKIVFCMIT